MKGVWRYRVQGAFWPCAMLMVSLFMWQPFSSGIALWLPDGLFVLMVMALLWRYRPGQYEPVALWGLWIDVLSQGALGAHMLFYVLTAALYWHHQRRMMLYSFSQRCMLLVMLVGMKALLFSALAVFSHHAVPWLGGIWGWVSTLVLLIGVLWYNEKLDAGKASYSWLM